MSAFVVSHIAPSLNIDSSQRFIFGLTGFPESIGSLKLDNIYMPIIGSPSLTNLELRNNVLAGYRWSHETKFGETYGTLKLQKFLNNGAPIDILAFNDDGSLIIPSLEDAKYILQTPNAAFTQAQALSELTTGLIKNTTATGVLSIAVAGTDYFSPGQDMDLQNKFITNLHDPVNAQDAATKAYVSSSLSGSVVTLTGDVTGSGSLGSPIATTLAIDSPHFAKLGIGVAPSTDGRIEFANISLDTKIRFFTNNTPDNPFDQSGMGYLATAGTLYHCPIGQSHLFFVGANGNLPVEINALGMIVAGNGYSPTDFRKIIFYQNYQTTNPHQTYAHGILLTGTAYPDSSFDLRAQIASSAGAFSWGYGVSSSASYELMRLDAAHGLVVKNQTPATAGNDSYTDFKLENSAMGGYRFRHTSFSGNPSIGMLALQVMDATGSALDIFNTGFSSLSLPGFGGDRYTIFGAFNVNASLATLGVNEGKQNVLNEASCFRVVSSTNAAKIEIQNTGANGRLYEIRSQSDGGCGIFDRTSNALRFLINASGAITIGIWNGSVIGSQYGGTGVNNGGRTLSYAGNVAIGGTFQTNGNFTVNGSFSVNQPFSANGGVTMQGTFVTNGNITLRTLAIGGSADVYLPTSGTLATQDYVNTSTMTLTGSVTGTGNVNGSLATSFSNNQSVTGGDTQTFTFTPSLASAYFNLFNANTSATSQIRIGNSGNYLACGYAAAGGYAFFNAQNINSMQFSINGITQATLTGIGLGLGTLTPTAAKLQIVGGVQNIIGEDTALRVSSSLNNVKIELQSTAAGGKLYELRSSSVGSFDITDRTGSATRFTISTSGECGVSGDFVSQGTIYGRRSSGMIYMEGNAVATTLTANVWTKLGGTTTASGLLKNFTSPVSNRLTYVGTRLFNGAIMISVTLNFSAGAASTTRDIALFKNGIQVTPSLMSESSASGLNLSIYISTFLSLTTNDYIEVWCRSSVASNVTPINLIMISIDC